MRPYPRSARLAFLGLLTVATACLLWTRDASRGDHFDAPEVGTAVPCPCGPEFVTPFPAVMAFKDPPTPAVALRVRVPACGAAGKDLVYRVTVENCSGATAHHVQVRMQPPTHARYLRASPETAAKEPEIHWHLGTLAPSECRELCLVVRPLGTGEVKTCARVQFEHGQCVCTRVGPAAGGPGVGPPKVGEDQAGAAKLQLTINGPKQRFVNLPARYELRLTNAGNLPAGPGFVCPAGGIHRPGSFSPAPVTHPTPFPDAGGADGSFVASRWGLVYWPPR